MTNSDVIWKLVELLLKEKEQKEKTTNEQNSRENADD